MATRSAAVTHNHPEGIKGAQAIAAAIFLAKRRESKTKIREQIGKRFAYDVSRSLGTVRATCSYDMSCQLTVPQAIIAFLDSTSVEDAIRNAVSLGGNSDTIAAMAGGIAEAYFGMPRALEERALGYLDASQRAIVQRFPRRR